MADTVTADGDVFATVVGQAEAVAALRRAAGSPLHAYLLTGPAGTGKRTLATAFAAAVLCADQGCGRCESCRRVLAGVHPDVSVVERTGPFITMETAREVVSAAGRAPVEGSRKVVVLADLHLVREAGPALLKTIEEPSPSTVIIGLADDVPPELVTIASRSAVVRLGRLGTAELVADLVGRGHDPVAAEAVAGLAAGRIDRARLLATDEKFAARHRSWLEVPDRLDGTGAQVAAVADDIASWLDEALEPLAARQAQEVADLDERAKATGERGSGRKDLVDRHRRELRRARTDELLFGLATVSGVYRDQLRAGRRPAPALAALDAIARANEAIRSNRNPTEAMLLHRLLCVMSSRS